MMNHEPAGRNQDTSVAENADTQLLVNSGILVASSIEPAVQAIERVSKRVS
jgi:hypothetical protein